MSSLALLILGLFVLAAAAFWGANALWVSIISDRWNAMCNEHPTPGDRVTIATSTPDAASRERE